MSLLSSLPFSQACENNKTPIVAILKQYVMDDESVLEVGSGTGQHAVYFSEQLTKVVWQPSDREINLAHIRAWQNAFPYHNCNEPLLLDIDMPWPSLQFTHCFTANTLHIISWSQVTMLLAKVAAVVSRKGYFFIYGPFNYAKKFTSDSNRQFHNMLQARDEKSGLRDQEAVLELAQQHDFLLVCDHAMPANNRLLVLQKQ